MKSRENEATNHRDRARESRPGCYAAWEAALFASRPSPDYDNPSAQFLTSSPEEAVAQSTWMQQTTLVLYFCAFIPAEIICIF